jgi:hypothetical protein
MSVVMLVEAMQAAFGRQPQWRLAEPSVTLEMQTLALDSTLARQTLAWDNRLIGSAAVHATAEWYLAFHRGQDMGAYTLASIDDYLRL